MKKSIVSLFVFLAGFGVFTTSCEDVLTPDMERYTEGFNGKDTVNFYLGIMRNVQDMVEQNIILNEVRADLADTTMYSSDSIARIARFDASLKDGESALLNRAAYYKVINQCNFYLAKADSNAIKNDILYMRKEIAQVHMVRAWTYMQLVQNYGRVPFITVPVDNANTGWETNPAEGWATPENLIDLLEPTLLLAAQFEKSYGFPDYGQFNTGKSGVNISHKLMLFPSDLVLGDLYLLRGNGTADYEKAAMYYYTWLEDHAPAAVKNGHAVSATFPKFDDVKRLMWGSSKNWYGSLVSYSNAADETITLVPSAANKSFGSVLTRIANIYGFETSSFNQTSGSGESVATNGEISIKPNAKMRQVGPSQRYVALNKAQTYVTYESENKEDVTNVEVEYYNEGDGRLNATTPYFQTEDDGKPRFIHKFGVSDMINQDGLATNRWEFKYALNVYRKRQVYLRFAEAINRAGFPGHAFAILRDGLHYDKFPELTDSLKYDAIAKADSVSNDTLFQFYRTTWCADTLHQGTHNLAISPDELLRAKSKPFLDFSDSKWVNSAGIHALGCGQSDDNDTIYTYTNVVSKRIAAEWKRTGYLVPFAAKKSARNTSETVYADTVRVVVHTDSIAPVAADEWEIEAVETLIADEMALETAFEGFRYFDLMRMARHKNNAGLIDGNEWFAWMISNRSVYQAPYAEEEVDDAGNVVMPVGQQNIYLYELLKNQSNWYLPNPIY